MRTAAYSLLWLFVLAIPFDRLPFESVVGLDLAGTMTRVIGGVALSAGLITTLFEARLRPFDRSHIFVYLFVGWVALSCLWSQYPDGALARTITYVQLGLMVWLLTQFARTQTEQLGLSFAYVAGSFCVASLVLAGFLSRQAVFGLELYPGRFTTLGYDPNDMALTLAVGIPMAWYVYVRGRGVIGFVSLLYMPVAACSIVLAASRGGAIAAAVSLMIIVFGFLRATHFRKVLLTVIIGLAVVFAAAVVPERTWDRLQSVDREASQPWSFEALRDIRSDNTRLEIWAEGLEVFREHQFLGVGVGGYVEAVDPVRGEQHVAHNVFISILVELGAIGLLIFLMLIGALVWVTRLMEVEERLLWLFVLATLVVGGFFLTWEHTKQTWFVAGMIAARAPLLRSRRNAVRRETQRPRVVSHEPEEEDIWTVRKRMIVDVLLVQDIIAESDEPIRLLEYIAAQDEEWSGPGEVAAYFSSYLDDLPRSVRGWKKHAKVWAAEFDVPMA